MIAKVLSNCQGVKSQKHLMKACDRKVDFFCLKNILAVSINILTLMLE